MKAIIGQKLGMTQIFDDEARTIPVTVIKAGPCHVVQVKRPETDGYSAVQISFGEVKPSRVNKPQAGHFAKAGVAPTRNLVEVRVDDVDGYEVGQELDLDRKLETRVDFPEAQGPTTPITGLSSLIFPVN